MHAHRCSTAREIAGGGVMGSRRDVCVAVSGRDGRASAAATAARGALSVLVYWPHGQHRARAGSITAYMCVPHFYLVAVWGLMGGLQDQAGCFLLPHVVASLVVVPFGGQCRSACVVLRSCRPSPWHRRVECRSWGEVASRVLELGGEQGRVVALAILGVGLALGAASWGPCGVGCSI